ncbi:MAG: D-alanine--D-alanine ligase [Pseudomonadota bacterium]
MTLSEQLQQLTVAVLYGGTSAERDVSLASADTVIKALRDGGYSPVTVDTAEADWMRQIDGADLAFNTLHGRGGEDGVIQGVLASLGIAYTGSGVLGSALAMDKQRTKMLWNGIGLPTADFVELRDDTDFAAVIDRLGAVFVKPALEGSSVGMSCADSGESLRDAFELARQHQCAVIAEALIDGPEYTVAILGDRALPTIRIEATNEFYDYDAKYISDATKYFVPSGLSLDEETLVADLALQAFQALDCSVWGRVDLMRDSDGRFLLLEANTVPGMTTHSLVPKAAEAAGMDLLSLLEEILWLSYTRQSVGK